MTSKDIYTFKPTYLYVKQHKITGKLYFGMTQKDPEKYRGSGKHWVRHIKTHGVEHVETLWYCLFLDQESITEFALNFSKQENIVESEDWLNLMSETGMMGVVHTPEIRRRMSESRIGMKFSESHKAKMREKILSPEHKAAISEWSKNRRHSDDTKKKIRESNIKSAKTRYIFITPFGTFDHGRQAEQYMNLTARSIYLGCLNNDKPMRKFVVNKLGLDERFIGKTWKEAGFSLVAKP